MLEHQFKHEQQTASVALMQHAELVLARIRFEQIKKPIGCACLSSGIMEATDMWVYVMVGSHYLTQNITIINQRMDCAIPLSDFQELPPRQQERMNKGEDAFLILGNGMVSHRYVLTMRDLENKIWVFTGPQSQQDCMVVRLVPKETLVMRLTAAEEMHGDSLQHWVRFKVSYLTTGRPLKEDGWVLPSTDRIYLRSVADLVLHELDQQDKGGPHVDLKFVGRNSDTLLSWNAPLFEPRSNVAKPAFRCWGKTTQGAAAMMTKMEKE